MDLLGLSGTHQVKATEIKDGKIWMSDTLRQLQSLWIVSVPKQIQAAMVAPKLYKVLRNVDSCARCVG